MKQNEVFKEAQKAQNCQGLMLERDEEQLEKLRLNCEEFCIHSNVFLI